MLELFKKSLQGQFEAALSMLGACVSQCPDDKWEDRVGSYPFWHVAYHALFYADLYLSRDHAAFEPRPFYREDYQYFGKRPSPPHEPVVADVVYDRATLAGYVAFCRNKAAQTIAAETDESLAGPSGFWWYQIGRAEFHLNNVRHVQHHAAQMSLSLRNSAGIGIDWVGSGWRDQALVPRGNQSRESQRPGRAKFRTRHGLTSNRWRPGA